MALTLVQTTKNHNGLAQTFNATYSGTPTEGNLLVAYLWHDETSADIATITSSGWTRMATEVATLAGFDYRIHIFAKFAGASESTTVSFDLGEVNRRAHGYATELSGAGFSQVNAADSAPKVSGANSTASTSNQVDSAIDVPAGLAAFDMVGLNGTSTVRPSWASEITEDDDWSANFRASAVGHAEGEVNIQPTATWGSNRSNLQLVAVVGVPPPSSKVLKGSSFSVKPASA